MTDDDLPDFWRAADQVSLVGQRSTLRYSAARLGGSLLAAVGGVISWTAGRLDVAALLIAVGFVIALAGELASWIRQPEGAWYDGRAAAESTKTLAWRYAVAADPFPVGMDDARARDLFRERLKDIADQVSGRVLLGSAAPIVTPAMQSLRQAPFPARRDAYVAGRTEDQHVWYAAKAAANARAATGWRLVLVTAELTAVVLAVGRLFGGWDIDFAGLMGAMVAAGAAWVALKQYSPLAAAYSTAANELAMQADRLRHSSEPEWAAMAADAEEAISREHTLWRASRTNRE